MGSSPTDKANTVTERHAVPTRTKWTRAATDELYSEVIAIVAEEQRTLRMSLGDEPSTGLTDGGHGSGIPTSMP